MNNLPIKRVYWLVPFVALSLLSCVQVSVPPAPDITVDAGETCTSSGCRCPAVEMSNRAFRFTDLKAVEPENLAPTLNGMWEIEIANYITNVLFVVVDAVDGANTEEAAFDAMRLVAGPGWREPSTPYRLDEGLKGIEHYFFLDDLQVGLTMTPKPDGYQCELENADQASLLFYIGPAEDPLMCAPTLLPQPNTTPIENLQVSFTFNADCTKIEHGQMTGCIPLPAAERICICQNAGTCVTDDANSETEFQNVDGLDEKAYTDPLVAYCKSACGFRGGEELDDDQSNWASFGAILDSTGTRDLPRCTVNTGEYAGDDGIALTATFRGEEVTDLFDPSSMPDIDPLFSSADE